VRGSGDESTGSTQVVAVDDLVDKAISRGFVLID
jgi:hypothetical protein